MADRTTEVSGERIGAELRRILTDRHRARGAALLAEAELLRPLLPELAAHAAAADADWEAALVRLARLSESTVPLAFAALLYGMVDAAGARELGRRVRLSNKEIDRIAWLLDRLPRMLDAATLPWPRLQRLLAHEGGPELLRLAASMLPDDDPGLARCRAALARPASEWNPPPLVTGDGLIAHGLKPGRHFASLLEHLRDEQLAGRVRTPEDALAEAKRWIAAATSSGR
jgi:tRNA nucleotidyltransferase/poly(A) polymerase